MIVFLPIEKIRERDGAGGEIGFAFADGDELRGIRIWKWAKEDGVDDAEERCVGADAESKGKDGDGGEPRGLSEEPEGVTRVLEERFEEREGLLLTQELLGLFQATEFEESVAAGLFRGHTCPQVVVNV